jgi:hypothetical protein
MSQDPWGTGVEIADEQYCCAFCPTANDGSFAWNPIMDQEICGNCEREIYLAFVWPESQRGVVDLYPPVVRKMMDATGLSFRECQLLYLDNDISSLSVDIFEDDDDGTIKVFITPDGAEMTRSELLEKLRRTRKHILMKGI